MELKVCPSLCASASAAEFRVLPARRESSSKALSEPSEMLKYLWVFPLSCHPCALRSHWGLSSPRWGERGHRIPAGSTTQLPIPHIPGKTPIFSEQASARAFFYLLF